MELTVVEGDITEQDVDAVVNAANRAMRGGGGVDGAIHRAGGPAVLEDCIARFPHGLATGDAGWTTAGEMPARWVIHVVGPNYARRRDATARCSTSCYARALAVADELGARVGRVPAGQRRHLRLAEGRRDRGRRLDPARRRRPQVEEARMVAFDAGDVRRAGGGASMADAEAGRSSCSTSTGSRSRTSTCGWRRTGCCGRGRCRRGCRPTRGTTGSRWPSATTTSTTRRTPTRTRSSPTPAGGSSRTAPTGASSSCSTAATAPAATPSSTPARDWLLHLTKTQP